MKNIPAWMVLAVNAAAVIVICYLMQLSLRGIMIGTAVWVIGTLILPTRYLWRHPTYRLFSK